MAEPINFGNPINDPVRVVIGLAGNNDNSHLQNLQIIADKFEDETFIDKINACKKREEIVKLFNGKEG